MWAKIFLKVPVWRACRPGKDRGFPSASRETLGKCVPLVTTITLIVVISAMIILLITIIIRTSFIAIIITIISSGSRDCSEKFLVFSSLLLVAAGKLLRSKW